MCHPVTFGGIMESPEWYGLVEPIRTSVEDWVHGMVAVINALGRSVWRVETLVPGKELVVRIYNAYEGEDFYFSVFNNPEGYWNVEQTHAVACGDAYDRIVTPL